MAVDQREWCNDCMSNIQCDSEYSNRITIIVPASAIDSILLTVLNDYLARLVLNEYAAVTLSKASNE